MWAGFNVCCLGLNFDLILIGFWEMDDKFLCGLCLVLKTHLTGMGSDLGSDLDSNWFGHGLWCLLTWILYTLHRFWLSFLWVLLILTWGLLGYVQGSDGFLSGLCGSKPGSWLVLSGSFHGSDKLWSILDYSVVSDLCPAGLRCLAQYREAFHVLDSTSFLWKLLIQRDIKGEHQRLHLVPDWTLKNTDTEQNLNNPLHVWNCSTIRFVCFRSVSAENCISTHIEELISTENKANTDFVGLTLHRFQVPACWFKWSETTCFLRGNQAERRWMIWRKTSKNAK